MNNIYRRVNDVRKEDRPLGSYIGMLQTKGKIKKYLDKDGYVCYSVKELDDYRKNVKMGRPTKNAVVITD